MQVSSLGDQTSWAVFHGYQGCSNEFESGEATSGNLFVLHGTDGSEDYLSSSISNLHAYASVETE